MQTIEALEALTKIHRLMDRKEWSPDTLQEIAQVLTNAGYQVRQPDCTCEDVTPNDPYWATPCGTFCPDCMAEHVKQCGVCAKAFPEACEEEEE